MLIKTLRAEIRTNRRRVITEQTPVVEFGCAQIALFFDVVSSAKSCFIVGADVRRLKFQNQKSEIRNQKSRVEGLLDSVGV